ncbi:MAG: VOC family protein [Planctomycetes bacterium]|nr:VOC family protein [Planctomycetota bacterium]
MDSLRFHHLGLLTDQRETAARSLAAFGYTVGETVGDPRQRADLCLAVHPQLPGVECITPWPDNTDLTRLLQRRSNHIYHVCYAVADVAGTVRRLEAEGVRLLPLSPPTAATLFGGDKVSFYMVEGMGMVEFLETAAADTARQG